MNKSNKAKPTVEQIAAFFKATPEQVRAQFAKNAKYYREAKVKASNGKYRGYTAEQYESFAQEAEAKSKGKN